MGLVTAAGFGANAWVNRVPVTTAKPSVLGKADTMLPESELLSNKPSGIADISITSGTSGANYLNSVSIIATVRAISAEDANAPFVAKGWSPPYDTDSQVRTFTTTADVVFVRVSTTENPQGAFLVRADEIKGMTANQTQQYLALPKVPTQVAEVIVPAGTKMQVGIVAAQPDFGVASKGGVQYQLINSIPSSSFGSPRPIK